MLYTSLHFTREDAMCAREQTARMSSNSRTVLLPNPTHYESRCVTRNGVICPEISYQENYRRNTHDTFCFAYKDIRNPDLWKIGPALEQTSKFNMFTSRPDNVKLLKLVYRGAYGEIYETEWHTRDPKETRHVVTKKITLVSTNNTYITKNVVAMCELTAAAHCEGPCLPTYNASWMEDGHLYLCMDMYPSLQYALNKCVRIPGKRRMYRSLCLRVTAGVVRALCQLHGKGLIHNDTRLSNIRISRRLWGILIDFSSTIHAMHTPDDRRMIASYPPSYMAPEFIAGDLDPSFAKDVFAIGKCVYDIAIFAKEDYYSSYNDAAKANLVRFGGVEEGNAHYSGLFKDRLPKTTVSRTQALRNLEKHVGRVLGPDAAHFVWVCTDPDPSRRPRISDLACHSYVKGALEYSYKKIGKPTYCEYQLLDIAYVEDEDSYYILRAFPDPLTQVYSYDHNNRVVEYVQLGDIECGHFTPLRSTLVSVPVDRHETSTEGMSSPVGISKDVHDLRLKLTTSHEHLESIHSDGYPSDRCTPSMTDTEEIDHGVHCRRLQTGEELLYCPGVSSSTYIGFGSQVSPHRKRPRPFDTKQDTWMDE